MTHNVILAIGTNINHHENMMYARKLLKHILRNEICSGFMWTKPIDIDSGDFLNAVIKADTELEMNELEAELKNIEQDCGRNKEESMHRIIRMDIDILAYDDIRLHADDWNRGYIKKLMDEIGIRI